MTILEIRKLSKNYGSVQAVKELSFAVNTGEIYALLGPNGAGKTTTLEILEGLKKKTGGSISYFGKTEERIPDKIKEQIGVQLQKTALFPYLTVQETLNLFAALYRKKDFVQESITLFALDSYRKKLVKQLSGGQMQRLALACAVIHSPRLIFLDEPTTGLDTQNRRSLWDCIRFMKNKGSAVVLTTHYMDEAEQIADRVGIIDHGMLVAEGTPAGLLDQYKKSNLEELFLMITGKDLRD